jgi:bifunctional non-homologous end joining protein LigD
MLPPMLCGDDLTPLDRHPEQWAWMVKADGFRAQLHTRTATLWSRAGNHLGPAFPDALDAALATVSDVDLVLDCELVVLDDTARPDFAALSARAGCRSAAAVRRATATAPALLLAFDVLVLNGRDLRPLPWQERHAHLTQLGLGPSVTPGAPGLAYLEAHDDGPALIRATHDLGLEGVVAKHRHSPYLGRRADTWVKVKHAHARDVAGAPLRGWRRAS